MCAEGKDVGCCNCPFFINSCEYCVFTEGYIDNSASLIKEMEDAYGIRIAKYN